MSFEGTIDWTQELDRHRNWMLRVLRSRVGDWHAADDLWQEIALAVFRQAARPTECSKVAPWLYRLTVRQAINFHRRSGQRRRQVLTGELDSEVGHEPSPMLGLLALEEQAAIQAAIARLKPRDREILLLKYCEHWTYEQLAEHLGAKVKTIEYRLLRARKQLRRQIVNHAEVER